jgi:hypothetical protein
MDEFVVGLDIFVGDGVGFRSVGILVGVDNV